MGASDQKMVVCVVLDGERNAYLFILKCLLNYSDEFLFDYKLIVLVHKHSYKVFAFIEYSKLSYVSLLPDYAVFNQRISKQD